MKIKYKFHEVELTSKIMSYWENISDTNLGQVNIDEFKAHVLIKPKDDMVRRIKKSAIAHLVGFPPALINPKLIHGC